MLKQIVAATACAVAVGSVVAAPTFSLKNQAQAFAQGWDGRGFELKYTNYENFLDADLSGNISVNDVNYGVFKITSITAEGTTVSIWQDGDNGAELTGMFGGITVTQVQGAAPTITVNSAGGFLDVYINPVFSFNPGLGTGGYAAAGCAVGGNCYSTSSNVAGGGLFLQTNFVPGVLPGDLTKTVSGTFDVLTAPLTGNASGYLAVVGGPYAATFDSNGFVGGTADLFNQNSVCTLGQAGCDPVPSSGGVASDWVLGSEDPVRGAFVPEPGSLALIGLALAGAGMASRRRRPN